MNKSLRPLEEQVIVITGASSGIGLATAETAADAGATIVLAARSENAIQAIAERLTASGARALAVCCDVSQRAQVENLANTTIDHFGRIDTWINNAGTSIYGRLDEVSEEDSRRLFDINFWGVYYGSLAALPHLRRNGGALINVGSEVSEGVIPLQGMYSASKHAVKGLTDALRVEIEEVDHAAVSIALIQPTAVDTPFPQHARNYMAKEPKLPSPRIDPQRVADAILAAAVMPARDRKVGAMARFNTMLSRIAPRLGDRMSAKQFYRQNYEEPPRHPEGALYQSSETTRVVGQTRGTGGCE
ncbi:MAG TPA: SDR family oxidoreductase [Phycisphaerae bacterium]|nr:SDR family oxidoreductase [Phycisphaerae bacterium]